MRQSAPVTSSHLPTPLVGLIDDASGFESGDVAAPRSAARQPRSPVLAELVGSLVVGDRDLPDVPEGSRSVSVLATTGAGAVAGISRLAARRDVELASLNFSLRDLDDLAGNARRVLAAVEAARGVGDLPDEVEIFLELPATEPTHGWLAAADVAGEAEFGLTFRPGGAVPGGREAEVPPPALLAAWVEAALDRECAFRSTGDLRTAVADGSRHGFLNLLLATAALWDGGSVDEAAAILGSTDASALSDDVTSRGDDLLRARRWLWGVTSAAPEQAAESLRELGLLAR